MVTKTTHRVSAVEESLEHLKKHDTIIFSDHGMLVGSRCEFTCDKRLHHVFCNPISNKCECQKNYPVKIGGSSVSLNVKDFLLESHFTFFQTLHRRSSQRLCKT